MNRLGRSASPYLRQHADNPVHWMEWSDEAFAQARERDVPVLLSVGYAACHWCHVMAHESFEDPQLAAQMNDGFVCIKVDREERPDIDAVYMAATVAMTGQGGWPMTCFLTPDGEPFYCGTYFPPTPRGGMPGFGQLLDAIGDTWRHRRDEVFEASGSITEHLRANTGAIPAGPVIDSELLAAAVGALCADEDRRAGGFGGAPKFPPAAQLEALIRADEFGVNANALGVAERACSAMARGGIYDQLAGGFARYAVDADWVVPHFEKMLYDNALLLRTYAHLARRLSTGSRGEGELATRITEEMVAFLDEALWTGHGYASSLDADTDGVEGLTYVWTPAQLREALGDDDGRWAATLFTVTDTGTFENGTSTLQLLNDPDDVERFAAIRARLLAARAKRPQPARDDKVVVVWNALTITALVEAGIALGRPAWVARAAETAEALLRIHLVDGVVSTRFARSPVEGELRRVSLRGTVGEPLAALDDHAAFVTALLSLHQVTGAPRWRDEALTILDRAIAQFADPEAPGAWFDAPAGSLITRPRDPVDGATPAGASLMAEALLTAIGLAPEEHSGRYAELADQTLARAGLILQKMPRSAGHWITVALARVAGPLQVGVAQAPGSGGALAAQVRGRAPGGTVVVAGSRDTLPLLTGRGPVDAADAAYVCRGNVCGLPVTTADALAFD
ncbi:MAG: thioredoxin domain-containing protein [Gordonia sp. (in: high G+C Gram-positive bacteria)]|uniref:thioredoxin domain-containing protein n=1 Tax=Gordonia sp. (in: high G+C Gram-positive bacteria) TaxID=84139 RepID=UPI003BB6D2EA